MVIISGVPIFRIFTVTIFYHLISVDLALYEIFCDKVCSLAGMVYRKNSKYWDTQTSYRSCP